MRILWRLSVLGALLISPCWFGCSNDISQEDAAQQVEQDDAAEAAETGGLSEDEEEAALDAEQP